MLSLAISTLPSKIQARVVAAHHITSVTQPSLFLSQDYERAIVYYKVRLTSTGHKQRHRSSVTPASLPGSTAAGVAMAKILLG